jgi:TRAP-type C4-dicarboxylate transport system substrate-binding protein
MLNRLFFLVLSITMLAGSVLPATAGPVRLSYANFPPASTFPCVQMERWKTEVEKRTNGAVAVDTFPGGTLLGGKNMFRGIIRGQADIGCISLAYQPGVFPLMSSAELPLGFPSSTVASLAVWDLFQKYQPEEFSKVKVLTMFTSAPSNLMTKEPIKTLADLKGVEIRGAGIASKVLNKLGAVPVSMPMPETAEAIQKGLVQGMLTSFEVLMDMNFAEYCHYQTVGNFQVYPFAVIMNRKKYDRLPEEVKQVFEDLGREQALWTGQYMDQHVVEALAWTHDKVGTVPFELSAEDKAEAEKLLAPLTDEWKEMASGKGVPADQVLTDLISLKDKYAAEYPAK